MSKSFKVDLTGQRFGRLTVLEFVPTEGKTEWLCKCDCGKTVTVKGTHLIDGSTKSCGCFMAEKASMLHKKHGNTNTRLFGIWQRMKQRCYNPNADRYDLYGGRSIKVCPEWLNSFVAFRDWALSNGYNDTLSIDRIDVNGNYEPNNCRWVNMKTQCRNRRSNTFIEYQGEKITLAEAAERTGIGSATLQARYKKGQRGNELFRPIK